MKHKRAKSQPLHILIKTWLALSLTLSFLYILQKNAAGMSIVIHTPPVAWLLNHQAVIWGLWGLNLVGLFLHYFFQKNKKKQWAEQQKNLADLKNMSWKQFEQLVAHAFFKQGWKTEMWGQGGADGGIDLVIRKSSTKGIVQVKHWKGRVGAPIVREQYGLMHHHKVSVCYIVALGGFTKEAVEFSKGKSIVLIDGQRLIQLIQGS